MRLATIVDTPALEKISFTTFAISHPGTPVVLNYVEHILRPTTVWAVEPDKEPAAFIFTERFAPDQWGVRILHPNSMPGGTGVALIRFAFETELKLRPMKPDTKCTTQLDLTNPVEKLTHDSYKAAFQTETKVIDNDLVLDAKGIPVRDPQGKVVPKTDSKGDPIPKTIELSLTAQSLADFFGIKL